MPELTALGVADGLDVGEAYKAAGGKDAEHRAKIAKHPPFLERVAILTEEREVTEAMGPLGSALWQSRQTWRRAVASGDNKTMLDAAKLTLEVAKLMTGAAPPAQNAEGDGGESPRGPGRPPLQPKVTKISAERVRDSLQNMGVKPAEDEAA